MAETSGREKTGDRRTRKTRFVCISDTHNRNVKLPKGDVLIHAGDITNLGTYEELEKMVSWIGKADFECKIVVGGNHDVSLDKNFPYHNLAPKGKPREDPEKSISLFTSSPSITYLAHSFTTIALTSPSGPQTAFKVFASPASPARSGASSYFSAFQYPVPHEAPQDSEAREVPSPWDDIPPDTDILVTHTPPNSQLGRTESGQHVGCTALRQALRTVRPRLAVCGHVHAARGAEHVTWGASEGDDVVETWVDPAPEGGKNCLVDLRWRAGGETCVVNCAVMPERHLAEGHRRLNKPVVVDVELPVWE